MRRAAGLCLAVLLGLIGGQATAQGPETPPPTPVPPSGSPSPFPTVLHTPENPARRPRLSAPSGVLVDFESGDILFQKHAKDRRPIASVTKIMTALLVLEETSPADEVVASDRAAGQEGASLGLEPGERAQVGELLFALLLQSSNDASVALAEHVSGSVERFVDLMNRRAGELGLRDTRFASPNGLDDSGYSTARDLATLTIEAYRHDRFARIVATRFHEVPAPSGPPRRLQNRNALLWLYPDAIGVKTGFTLAAGACLVAAADREGFRLLAVVLGASGEAFSDAATLLEFGYARFERRTVVGEGEQFDPVPIAGRPLPIAAARELTIVLRRNDIVTLAVELDPNLELPLGRGDPVGEVIVAVEGEGRGRVTLVAARDALLPAARPAEWVGGVSRALAALFDVIVGWFT